MNGQNTYGKKTPLSSPSSNDWLNSKLTNVYCSGVPGSSFPPHCNSKSSASFMKLIPEKFG